MATVTLKDIRKSFGKTEVIHGVDAHVEDGEFIVIVGPSGCGKSTLLRMVAGLETVTSGEVSINGTVVNDREPMDRNIAMVFQNYALYPHMTVRANMAYGLKIAKVPKPEIEARVAQASAMLQLDPYLDRLPRQLSGGQRQRVAMGRAIVREPAVFLFDEPLSNLDAKLRVAMRLEIKELQTRLGITSLYVTHDQVEAMTLADRMIVMNDGRAEQIGRPLEVYENPATTFVASFIGSPPMNLFDSSLSGEGAANGAATAGVRPEHVRILPAALARDEQPSDERTITTGVTVRYCEPLGAETLVHMVLPAGTMVTARLSAKDEIPAAGTERSIAFDRNHVVFFDGDGRAIR